MFSQVASGQVEVPPPSESNQPHAQPHAQPAQPVVLAPPPMFSQVASGQVEAPAAGESHPAPAPSQSIVRQFPPPPPPLLSQLSQPREISPEGVAQPAPQLVAPVGQNPERPHQLPRIL
eukprot:TRINITY_DN859_c0_g1_i13.p2 TRINITY_DN859_c0_g1~~TRINITY_DN859_c0_g1_i13.p2  ORF type:complete len:119 (+),score=38.23 TRINITY_DN859_c0_g1_i13:277-633(+)